ncbi:MAG: hypothetical protein QNJ63_28100 [Calothrix sp. MO_192.B10]|nr:hypothetical protein [Calothrix sp. MO_192.B10]
MTEKKPTNTKYQRTRIDDLSTIGVELSEADLRNVSGGLPIGRKRSAGSCTEPGMCDDE